MAAGIPVATRAVPAHDGRRGGLVVGIALGLVSVTIAVAAATQAQTPRPVAVAAGWLAEVLLVYLFLSFPSGRLSARLDRLLVGAIGATVLLLLLPQLLPLGLVLALGVMVAVALRLQQRVRAATPLARRALTPVLGIATLRAGLLAVVVVAWWVEPTPWLLRSALWLLALMVPLIALAFLSRLVRSRLYAGRALERLAACLRGAPDAAALRVAFADAFEDPSVQIAFRTNGSSSAPGWTDARGQSLALPEPGSGSAVSPLPAAGTTVAAIVHDEALKADPALLGAGLSMAGVALENQRLTAEAEAAMREVKASRARILASGERERRRIERDLHDGAQQRLVALRIELELAEELVRHDPERGAQRLRRLEREVDDALEELRALAHGVYPPLLADRGLPDALRRVASRSAVPVQLDVRDVGRYPPEIESAVYYCVLEALQNVLKHARSARRVDVVLDARAPRELRVRVQDDGPGFQLAAHVGGAGMTSMRDRLVALGGDLDVCSQAGVGTVVRGWVPTVSRRW